MKSDSSIATYLIQHVMV